MENLVQLHHKSHVLVWQFSFLSQPQAVVNRKCINGRRQMLCMYLGKLLSPAVVFEITIHHLVRYLPGTNSVDFKHLQQKNDLISPIN